MENLSHVNITRYFQTGSNCLGLATLMIGNMIWGEIKILRHPQGYSVHLPTNTWDTTTKEIYWLDKVLQELHAPLERYILEAFVQDLQKD